MKIEIKTMSKTEEYYSAATGTVYEQKHFVELWIGGVRYAHECKDAAQARALAARTARDLGIATEVE